MNKLKIYIDKIYKKITKKDKWKIYLYLNNQCVKKIYEDEEFEPMNSLFIEKIYFKKHILGSNYAQVILKFYKLKATYNNKKEVHIETKIFEGVDVL